MRVASRHPIHVNSTDVSSPDVLVIGGGPSGAVSARLLAAWGHRVTVLAKTGDRGRGRAESLPPSAVKLLSSLGVDRAVEGAGFYPSTGNTVWWASHERRVEMFGGQAEHQGLQVFRPDFDRLLLRAAVTSGAHVVEGAQVRAVRFERDIALVDFEHDERSLQLSARMVLDASGRAGVLARRGFRRYEHHLRMQALVGVWHRPRGWDLADDTHTVVETHADGWAWSVPVSPFTRHIGVMVNGGASRQPRASLIREVYMSQLEKAAHVSALVPQASLLHSWACDASIYSADMYASPQFLLVGDAASTIDPLSSFGVKKALASAWMAAVTTHTSLAHADRRALALDYYAGWERQAFSTHLRQTRDFARLAFEQHPDAFWARRAEVNVGDAAEPIEDAAIAHPAVHAALATLQARHTLDLSRAPDVPLEKRPLIRDREVVLDDAVPLRHVRAVLRFLGGVDLVRLSDLACQHRHVAELYEAYCRVLPPVPLRTLLGGLSVLVANGILHPRSADA